MFLKISTLFFLLCTIIACKNTSKIEQSPNEENYRAIRSNVARIQAMLAGKYVQHTRVGDEDEYKTWLVNDDQDSVMMYSLPVGNPHKNGYWLYHYQIMTSLPDEPIYEAFEELIAIDRDSIKSVLYQVPKNFSLSLNELLKKKEKAFESINFDDLTIDEDGGYYIRQNVLFFKNQTEITKDEHSQICTMDIYEVHPSQIVFFSVHYEDLKGEKFISQEVSKFVKESTFN